MVNLWDYDESQLRRTKQGRMLILERLINYGPTKSGEKINLKLVKKYWDKLDLYEPQKHLLELLIWKKCFSHPSKNSFSIK